MPQLCRLKVRAIIDGSLREPGYRFTLPDGVRGPHKSTHLSPDRVDHDPSNGIDANRIVGGVADVPLYDVLDPEHEKAVDDLHAKHAEELAEHDGDLKRAEILRRHAEESEALRAEGVKREMDARHQREAEHLKARQAAESEAFEKRPPIVVPVPKDASPEALKARHEAEAKALDEAHKRDADAFAAAHGDKAAPEADPLPPAPSPVTSRSSGVRVG